MKIKNKKQIKHEARVEHRISIPNDQTMIQFREVLERYNYAAKATDILRKNATGKSTATAKFMSANPLVQLFLHGNPVNAERIQKLLAPMKVEDWTDAGLISHEHKIIRSNVKITPYNGLLIVSDKNWDDNASSNPNAVMGLAGSSLWLSHLTVRRKSRLTLDLGTGTGIQAMLAARHSKRVIGIDNNPRALGFAQFNSQLNNISNIKFIEGDLFEPVKGKKFDLIISNPPFSISPDCRCLYRDNPLYGDQFVANIVQQIPNFLAEGGFGQVLCHWEQRKNQKWELRLADWLRGRGCDAWVLRGGSTMPKQYARNWLKNYDPSNYEQLLGDWLAYYRQKKITSIGAGIITLQRSKGARNLFRVDQAQPKILANAGEFMEQGFKLQRFLDTRQDDSVLLKEYFRIPSHVLLDLQNSPTHDGWRLLAARLTLTHGLAYSLQISPQIMELVGRCNGLHSLGDLLKRIGLQQNRDIKEIIPVYIGELRKLIALGFLLPVAFFDNPAVHIERLKVAEHKR